MSNAELKRRLRRAALIVLLLGLASAALIYAFADEAPEAALGYVIVNGSAYPMSASDSKIYRREIQQFGGKAALLFDDLRRWFVQLWRGKALARTVAWISVLLALGLYALAGALGPDAGGDSTKQADRPG